MRIFIFTILATFFISCENTTTTSQDTEMLQSKYSTVYRISAYRYITADSTGVYDVAVTGDGKISSTIKIK